MNTLLRAVLLVYPRWWRERYGAEFQALLEDIRPGIAETINVLLSATGFRMRSLLGRASWRTIPAFVVVGGLAGASIAQLMPRQYAAAEVLRPPPPAPSVEESLQAPMDFNAELGLIEAQVQHLRQEYPDGRARDEDLQSLEWKIQGIKRGMVKARFARLKAAEQRLRLESARERFGSADADRSQIYIVYGPPGDIDSRPSREVWTYHHTGTEYEFTGTQYRLTRVRINGREYRTRER